MCFRFRLSTLLLLTLPLQGSGQILGFVPVSDSLFIVSVGDVGPSVFATIDSTMSGIDTVRITGDLYTGHFDVSHRVDYFAFAIQDTGHRYRYELWEVPDLSARSRIVFDRDNFIAQGHSSLLLLVYDGGSAVDSLKVNILVEFFVSVPLSGETLPFELLLYQNYPNPFNGSTVIRFSLPDGRVSKLSVYDLSGKEVSLLVSGYLPKGSYSVSWTPRDVPSGVYFLRFSSAAFAQTKRLVLLR